MCIDNIEKNSSALIPLVISTLSAGYFFTSANYKSKIGDANRYELFSF